MTPYYEADGITIYHGDCLDVMRELDAGSVDAIVTDPPYGLGFMGKAWDTKSAREFEAWCEGWGREALRVAKPGAHLLAFGAPRTSHRLVAGLEDAGWEIRDTVAWMFGSGFPKSLDVSKALDKAAGHWRGRAGAIEGQSVAMHGPRYARTDKGDPITTLAAKWQGWGTALKPAYEPVVLARKPLGGTVAAAVAEHGTGALNIDACRVGDRAARALNRGGSIGYGGSEPQGVVVDGGCGRWPANVVLDEAAAEMLDAAVGEAGGGVPRGASLDPRPDVGIGFHMRSGASYGDSGGPSRFFYTAKASTAERHSGLDSTYTVKYPLSKEEHGLCAETVQLLQRATSGTPTVRWRIGESGESITALCLKDSLSTTLTAIKRTMTSPTSPWWMRSLTSESTADANFAMESGGNPAAPAESSNAPTPTITNEETVSRLSAEHVASRVLSAISKENAWSPLRNIHSTVKPVSLMRWLVRLVTPPGGIVLDPFLGSGSTRIAAQAEGARFIGIEQDAEYLEIAVSRLAQLGMAMEVTD